MTQRTPIQKLSEKLSRRFSWVVLNIMLQVFLVTLVIALRGALVDYFLAWVTANATTLWIAAELGEQP
jgi:hypothetical protein